ncbi:flagellar hook-basal body complex protein [Amaricoccus tamworthensis]|uniref:flagellar hook-basal body complex protein n=1 Tax=Amaricoccus tamworthensis TaxID=57002 RepID=UPI003C7E2147
MDTASYVILTRQTGLKKELNAVANNVANLNTTGYQRQGVVFSEMVQSLQTDGGSVAMSGARGRYNDELQGALVQTGGRLDMAVEGDGYFQVLTPAGERLTRAGAFTRDNIGQVVNMDGYPLLNDGGGPIVIPFEAENVDIGPDGTVSVDGDPVGRVGLFVPEDPTTVQREAGTIYRVDGEVIPVETPDGRIVQGFVEQSNVNAITEIARMIEVQRAYERGQKLLEQENERISKTVDTLGKTQ